MGAREEPPAPLGPEAKRRLLELYRERGRRAAAASFIKFCRHPWLWEETPAQHHEYFVSTLERVARGELKRVIIIAPPGSAKSTYSSVRFAAWYLGRWPKRSLIAASHTKSLAARFGRKVRNLLGSPEFHTIFPECELAGDSQAKDDWATSAGGEYYAVGFDGAVSGRRADGILIDDPIKGRKEADSQTIRDNIWEVYKSDLRTRLKKDGWLAIITTRWHEDDLVGRILPESWQGESGWIPSRDGEDWYVLRIPMESEGEGDPLERPAGETLWREWWTPDFVRREKVIQGTRNWNALFQGVPSTEEGAILKAAYWRRWPSEVPPVCEYVLQSYDTAFEEDEDNDYSARTTWGVFDIYETENAKVIEQILANARERKEEVQRYHAILLEAWRGKVPFHALKKQAKDAFNDHQPDRVLIEKKASGHSLIQELRRGGLPIKAVKADISKTSRAHAAEPAFEQGCVWHMNREWAGPVIRECASFPTGQNDDYVDTVTQAINWLRKTYHLSLAGEDRDEDEDEEARAAPIYG